MKIIDNLLPKQYETHLENLLLGTDFPWYLNSYTVQPGYETVLDERTIDVQQFTHRFFLYGEVLSPFYHELFPLLVLLEKETGKSYIDRLLRIKANLIPRNPSFPDGCYNPSHIDDHDSNETLLYYVNDSDGDTCIFNEKHGATSLNLKESCSPRKGRCVLFDSSYMHSSTPPRVSDSRVVLNFVFRRTE